jgi:hypothetical protein
MLNCNEAFGIYYLPDKWHTRDQSNTHSWLRGSISHSILDKMKATEMARGKAMEMARGKAMEKAREMARGKARERANLMGRHLAHVRD